VGGFGPDDFGLGTSGGLLEHNNEHLASIEGQEFDC
jgi:hypothetical protein